MRNTVLRHLDDLTRGQGELAEGLPPEAFVADLGAGSNTIGAQFWCVVGARESYQQALIEGAWAGFNCSLTSADAEEPAKVVSALAESRSRLLETMPDLDWTAEREELLQSLVEHEAQHQGQLIRYVYALGYEFPQSWKERWAL